ncbi:cellulose synthase [Escherichia coli]
MPMVEAAPTAQQQLLEQIQVRRSNHREDLVDSSYIGWNLLIRITRRSLPPVSVLCYVRAMMAQNSSIGCRS